ncbi:aminoglycoside adenylyltransferase domain-containing protein [Streptomyces collinus]|uniref:aminoglycoside adenylyltransferase domain-containing protein n=1 Tax=Streptomyces collinus TaxID=42684 RepID=UPI00397FB361
MAPRAVDGKVERGGHARTARRIWTTLATGQTRSKDAAADWALAQLPPEHRPVLEHGRQLYVNCRCSEESWRETLRVKVRRRVDRVLAEIDRLSTRIRTAY